MTNGTLRAFGTVEEIGSQVSQQRTIEAHILKSKHVTPAAKVIRKLIEPDAEVTEAHGEKTVRFRTALSEAHLAQLLRHLIKVGVHVSQFREVQTDLEEAFMSFTNSPPPDMDDEAIEGEEETPAGATSDV